MLHQAADALEAAFVLEASVAELSADLVPAVGPQVVPGVDLAEEVVRDLVVVVDGEQDGRGAGRALEPHRAESGDAQAQLVTDRSADRVGAGAGHVEVCGAPCSVGDREGRFRHEQAQEDERHRAPEDRGEQHVGRMIDTQVHLGGAEHEDDHCGRGVAQPPPRSGGNGRGATAHEDGGERRGRRGRVGPSTPLAEDLDPERTGSPDRPGQEVGDGRNDDGRREERQQMPPAPGDDHGRDGGPSDDGDEPVEAHALHLAGERREPVGAAVDQRTHQIEVLIGEPDARALEPDGREPDDRGRAEDDQPGGAGSVPLAGEGRRLTGRTAVASDRVVVEGDRSGLTRREIPGQRAVRHRTRAHRPRAARRDTGGAPGTRRVLRR